MPRFGTVQIAVKVVQHGEDIARHEGSDITTSFHFCIGYCEIINKSGGGAIIINVYGAGMTTQPLALFKKRDVCAILQGESCAQTGNAAANDRDTLLGW